MEMRKRVYMYLKHSCLLIWAVLICVYTTAQVDAKCDFRDQELRVELNKKMSTDKLQAFISQYDLADLNLEQILRTNQYDTLQKLGWNIKVNTATKLIIAKSLLGSSNLKDPVNGIMYTDKQNMINTMFAPVSNSVVYGYNRFKNKYPFAENGAATLFFLPKKLNARQVMLAGSFNKWDPNALKMTKTDSGWVAEVKLQPGKYWYKFVVDYNWIIDDDNAAKENDGMGNTNSVYFKTNTVFELNEYVNAKKAWVAGSFNNWRSHELAMYKTQKGWAFKMYLADGTHTYKFLTDQTWHQDALNKLKLPDGHGNFNSVITKGTQHLFRLAGYNNASSVILSGSFNGWNKKELSMRKTATGWELPYALGSGNHEYKFIVDGKWITDPANPLTIMGEGGNSNSYLIIGANYTFRLKNRPDANVVFLAGDFNNWSPAALAMIRDGNDWKYSVHLSPGKHKYKFIVDGKWIADPDNKLWEQNEHNTGNSVLWIEK
jgi:hypothetical protein